ncbi:hypothetical protein [Sodalis glossinidius]|uniref:hypothetical protein n=1 Tax=Sodalis glossinidius TaxID=63612 RepID=UPI0002E70642|nr:hypothetical protein [Sodalis glossinidius]
MTAVEKKLGDIAAPINSNDYTFNYRNFLIFMIIQIWGIFFYLIKLLKHLSYVTDNMVVSFTDKLLNLVAGHG